MKEVQKAVQGETQSEIENRILANYMTIRGAIPLIVFGVGGSVELLRSGNYKLATVIGVAAIGTAGFAIRRFSEVRGLLRN